MTDGTIPGNVAWRLYDTYGFPVDLTQLMAEEKGLRVDRVAYAAAEATAKDRSRGEGLLRSLVECAVIRIGSWLFICVLCRRC